MVAVALYATDPASRRHLERLAGDRAGVTIVGAADSPDAHARLLEPQSADAFLPPLFASHRPDAATTENRAYPLDRTLIEEPGESVGAVSGADDGHAGPIA